MQFKFLIGCTSCVCSSVCIVKSSLNWYLNNCNDYINDFPISTFKVDCGHFHFYMTSTYHFVTEKGLGINKYNQTMYICGLFISYINNEDMSVYKA